MVKSTLRPNDINYKEAKNMDEEDVDYASSLYEYPLYGQRLIIALGKEKYTYSSFNIVYYPIYLIVNNEPRAKIGIFEVESNEVINIIDEDGDVDLEKGIVKMYDSATSSFINKLVSENPMEEVEELSKKDLTGAKETGPDIGVIDLTEEPTGVLDLQISKEKRKELTKSKDELFIIHPEKPLAAILAEESEEDANAMKEDYKEGLKTEWIEKFMHNNAYKITNVSGDGDCFFSVLCLAFNEIGKETTPAKLRTLLSKEATDEQFKQYRILYTNFLAELQDIEVEMKAIKKMMPVLKKRGETTKDKEEHKKILAEAKQFNEKNERLKLQLSDTKELMKEFDYMKNITDLEKFRQFIADDTKKLFWADTWAISTLEKLLKIKVIILSAEAFENGDEDAVLNCGQLNDGELQKEGLFDPEYYIIACYTGNHYKLVSYKEKGIFKFREIPYDIKVMVINKCMEKNAGPYYLIGDFRKLKNNLGLPVDEGMVEEKEDEYLNRDIYDKNTIFMFHANSNSGPKAGKGSGEKIDEMKLTEFNILNKTKDWRKKLDDSWIVPITVDNHRWNSVEHYYLGSQFKKGFPDFYQQFSLDSNTDISKDIGIARAAAGKTGKLKDRVLREKTIKTDPDFFEVGINQRSQEERHNALTSKFNQNLDLKSMLLETKTAKLVHFVRGKEAETDELLMKVRKELR
jgi:predicted NAD-dependent protein-ADP-ribosyltransferase YbiA (DUF1768 family)